MHSWNALAANDVYGVEFGTGYFYEQAWPQQAFDYRLEHVVNHVHTTLGQPWKELSGYIFAFEAENEAMIGKVIRSYPFSFSIKLITMNLPRVKIISRTTRPGEHCQAMSLEVENHAAFVGNATARLLLKISSEVTAACVPVH